MITVRPRAIYLGKGTKLTMLRHTHCLLLVQE